jgi:hypothetical protein
MFAALLPILGPLLSQIVGSAFPNAEDEAKRLQAQNAVQIALMQQASVIETAAADIVKTEAQSDHWLAACWRPILMLTFGALIVARWMGWAAPGLSESEALKLWDIINVGLGGYVIGRTAEKVAPQIAAALKR